MKNKIKFLIYRTFGKPETFMTNKVLHTIGLHKMLNRQLILMLFIVWTQMAGIASAQKSLLALCVLKNALACSSLNFLTAQRLKMRLEYVIRSSPDDQHKIKQGLIK